MTRSRIGIAVSLTALMVAGGCGTINAEKQAIATKAAEASAMAEQAKKPLPVAQTGSVMYSDAIWIGSRSFVNPHGEPLPSSVERSESVVVNSLGSPMDLGELATEITSQTGLPVVIDNGPVSSAQGQAGATQTAGKFPVVWSGPLSGLLDSASSWWDISWEYRDGKITLYNFLTRTFTLAALPMTSTVTAKLGNNASDDSSNSGGSSSNSNTGQSIEQDTSNESSIKVWDDIKSAVEVMLKNTGGTVALAPSTGTITISAKPAVMAAVEKFISDTNARMTRQVAVSVKVMTLSLTEGEDLGVDLSLAFKKLAGNPTYNILMQGPTSKLSRAVDGTASYSIAVMNNQNTTDKGRVNVDTTNSVIQALQTLGNVSLVTETSVTTLNGQVAPVSVARQQSYVSSVQTTSDGNGVTQTAITPGTLSTGFNMHVLPRIMDDGRVMLQYGMGLSELREISTFTSGTSSVQLPDVDARSFLQQVVLHSGDALVLAGYQQTDDRNTDRSTPGIGMLLGGSSTASKTRTVIVIMLTPNVLDNSTSNDMASSS